MPDNKFLARDFNVLTPLLTLLAEFAYVGSLNFQTGAFCLHQSLAQPLQEPGWLVAYLSHFS